MEYPNCCGNFLRNHKVLIESFDGNCHFGQRRQASRGAFTHLVPREMLKGLNDTINCEEQTTPDGFCKR